MLQIVRAQSRNDFEQAHTLIAEMGIWDVECCNLLGLRSDGVLSAYYSDDIGTLREKFGRPRSGFFLARNGTATIGCVGYLAEHDSVEITKLYVRPEGRGRGAGRLLLTTAINAAQTDGTAQIRLVTISFMTEAIALYRRTGFIDCDPFEAAPAGLEAATRYMKLAALEQADTTRVS